jgi:acetyl esterase/lipase
MVICSGGGYGGLDPRDGNNYALWLNRYGVTCFVLKYRLGTHGYHYPAMLDDVTRAVRWARAHADKFNLNPNHVGIMGVSAGGHLAAMLMTHFDTGDPKAVDPVERQSSRPDFGVLCYPIITMMGEFANKVSRDNLLGSNAPTKLKRLTSVELHVTFDTPPCFLWSSVADDGVRMENTMMFAEALRQNGVRFELHVYERGVHGAGLMDGPPSANSHLGTVELHSWLKEHKWAN